MQQHQLLAQKRADEILDQIYSIDQLNNVNASNEYDTNMKMHFVHGVKYNIVPILFVEKDHFINFIKETGDMSCLR